MFSLILLFALTHITLGNDMTEGRYLKIIYSTYSSIPFDYDYELWYQNIALLQVNVWQLGSLPVTKQQHVPPNSNGLIETISLALMWILTNSGAWAQTCLEFSKATNAAKTSMDAVSFGHSTKQTVRKADFFYLLRYKMDKLASLSFCISTNKKNQLSVLSTSGCGYKYYSTGTHEKS